MLVWVDTETTGLDPDRCVLLEVAVVVTDDDLNETAHMNVVIGWPDLHERLTDLFVVDMHTRNGLIEACGNGFPVAEAEKFLVQFLTAQGATGLPMCGSSVDFDRRFLTRHMPTFARLFHYRTVDVSGIKELVRRWYPDLTRPVGRPVAHRALDDIRSSIEELRFYRNEVFTTREPDVTPM